MDYLSIKNWALHDRPREKLIDKGVRSLTDTELIAVLLGSGTREKSALALGRQVLANANNSLLKLGKMSIADLTKIKGVGNVKAVSLLAAMELGRRRNQCESPEKIQITSSQAVFKYLSPFLSELQHEEFWVVYLNRSNRILSHLKVSQGGISGTIMDIRLILKRALELLASSMIVAHNHPSGNLEPSENDKKITLKLKEAADQMDIKLLDHLIVTDTGYYSFGDEGLL